jgi:hypothetical protein
LRFDVRTRKPVAILCVAIVVFAALLPTAAIQLHVLFTPLWLIAPGTLATVAHRAAPVYHEQTASLLSLAASRAPPAGPVPA